MFAIWKTIMCVVISVSSSFRRGYERNDVHCYRLSSHMSCIFVFRHSFDLNFIVPCIFSFSIYLLNYLFNPLFRSHGYFCCLIHGGLEIIQFSPLYFFDLNANVLFLQCCPFIAYVYFALHALLHSSTSFLCYENPIHLMATFSLLHHMTTTTCFSSACSPFLRTPSARRRWKLLSMASCQHLLIRTF